MPNPLNLATIPLFLLVTVLGLSPAASAKVEGEKPTLYAVIQIGESLEVIPAAEVKERKESTAAADKAALEKWGADKKAATKAKEKFDEPKPKKTAVKVHGAKFKTMDEANEAKAKIEAKAKGKGAKKG